MLMLLALPLARLVRSESFWAAVKVRSPHTGQTPAHRVTGPEPLGYGK